MELSWWRLGQSLSIDSCGARRSSAMFCSRMLKINRWRLLRSHNSESTPSISERYTTRLNILPSRIYGTWSKECQYTTLYYLATQLWFISSQSLEAVEKCFLVGIHRIPTNGSLFALVKCIYARHVICIQFKIKHLSIGMNAGRCSTFGQGYKTRGNLKSFPKIKATRGNAHPFWRDQRIKTCAGSWLCCR